MDDFNPTSARFEMLKVFHPVLFAIYFVISSLALVYDQVPLEQAIRPLIIVPAVTLLIFVTVFLIFKDWDRAGILALIFVVWMLFYGHMYNVLAGVLFPELLNINPYIVFATWTVLLIFLGSNWSWRRLKNPAEISRILNVTSIIVLIYPGIRLGRVVFENLRSNKVLVSREAIELPYQNLGTEYLPDVYYFILDGYGRGDVLEELYGFNNSDFYDFLRKRGFYIAEQSSSNYIQTALSVASTLNLGYLDDLSRAMGESKNRGPLKTLIQNNRVVSFLDDLGYDVLTFSSGFYFTENVSSDFYLSPFDNSLNEFEQLILSVTAFGLLIEPLDLNLSLANYGTHRERINYIFENVADITRMEGPTFVFIHLLAPHPPFVFDEEGLPINNQRAYSIGDGNHYSGSREEYLQAYVKQVIFVNSKVEDAIDQILDNSTIPPIIVIQGDHGPGALLDWDDLEGSCLWERTSILNAYYLPNTGKIGPYASITPSNSFRLILDSYFGTELGLIEDASYLSGWKHPYHFVDITDRVDLKENCER